MGNGVIRRNVGKHLASETESNEDDQCIADITLPEQLLLISVGGELPLLSLLNDTLSYVLRGSLLIELALRKRIATIRRIPRLDPIYRHLQVIDATPTGDLALDEVISFIGSEKHSVGTWVDILAGETWNPFNGRYQVKQLRERIAKSLVEKGILRISRKTYLYLFEISTLPIKSRTTRDKLIKLIQESLEQSDTFIPALSRENVPENENAYRPILRINILTASLLISNTLEKATKGRSYTASMLKATNILKQLAYEEVSGNDIVAGVMMAFLRMDSLVIR